MADWLSTLHDSPDQLCNLVRIVINVYYYQAGNHTAKCKYGEGVEMRVYVQQVSLVPRLHSPAFYRTGNEATAG